MDSVVMQTLFLVLALNLADKVTSIPAEVEIRNSADEKTALAGLGGLLYGDGSAGGMHVVAAIPLRQRGSAGLGGKVDGTGGYYYVTQNGGVAPEKQVGVVQVIREEPKYVVRTDIPNYVEKNIQVPSYVENPMVIPTINEKKADGQQTFIEKSGHAPAHVDFRDPFVMEQEGTPVYVTPRQYDLNYWRKYVNRYGYNGYGAGLADYGYGVSSQGTYTKPVKKTNNQNNLLDNIFNIWRLKDSL